MWPKKKFKMSLQGIVTTIKAPVLKGVTQSDLRKFQHAYVAYKEQVEAINKTQIDPTKKVTPATIKDCFDRRTLDALCSIGMVEGASSAEDVTAEQVEAWFEKTRKENPYDVAKRNYSAHDSFAFVEIKSDTAGVALTFIIGATESLKDNGVEDVLSDVDKAKFVIDELEDKIEPEIVRARVRRKRLTWTKAQKGNIREFHKAIAAAAVDHHEHKLAVNDLRLRRKNKRNLDNGKPDTPKPDAPVPKPPKKAKVWTDPCLNPKCTGKHRIEDCPITPVDQRKTLLKEFFQNKKNSDDGGKKPQPGENPLRL